ncbi:MULTISPECIES: hypothetical protein [unclassified Aerococcus]|uniref:hypothetical protein n=1 Tax=unclassified Aerococcus TaxID=2618060 RepID=UPI0008A213CE|nr:MULTISPECIES: hypothetical protein [unclassified Aerococcus]MDK6679207.1 hypothetical protein [Aerococcus sp. UMB8608]MDK6685951.1 hypothetical protein [Aerococcus sp. UMB8623]MDK6940755.1 hypothetical protein [Aerococcus sp. UMB8487]OFK21271.1 hypothetical protein HMPREF2829_03770 [Aerococcus sp. HMSC072A12]OFR32573.1 hypothetical protein HMPREF2892_08145 [Aerococcus sp. HMSC061A03]
MYRIRFLKNSHLKLTPNKYHDIYEGIELMQRWNSRAKASDKSFDLDFYLYHDDDDLLKDFITLGKNQRLDFIDYVTERIESLKLGEHQKELLYHVEEMSRIYQRKRNQVLEEGELNAEINSIQKANKITGLSNKEESNKFVENEDAVKEAKKKEKEATFSLKHINSLISLKKPKHRSLKQLIAFGLVLVSLLLIFSSDTISYVKNHFNQVTSQEYSEEDLQKLLKSKRFDQALKNFPQEYPKIEQAIFSLGEEGIPYLEDFIDRKSDFEQATFDLEFLKKNYVKVIELKKYADTDARKIQLALAYIEEGKLDEAKKINDVTKFEELNILLKNTYLSKVKKEIANNNLEEAKKLAKESQDKEIESLIELTEDIDKNIEKIEKLSNEEKNKNENKIKLKELKKTRNELLGEYYE